MKNSFIEVLKTQGIEVIDFLTKSFDTELRELILYKKLDDYIFDAIRKKNVKQIVLTSSPNYLNLDCSENQIIIAAFQNWIVLLIKDKEQLIVCRIK